MLNQARKPPPPLPLDLPETAHFNAPDLQRKRSPSPLRETFTASPKQGSEDGSDISEDDHPSIVNFASSFAQRVNSLVSNSISPRNDTHQLPSGAEIEAEAQRERERGRREAERILVREAEERRRIEDQVNSMLDGPPENLPRPRAQTLPSGGSSGKTTPTKEPGWWSAAKNRLTPTKENLTPAQQLVQDTKAKEKRKSKEKSRPESWYTESQQPMLSTPPRNSQMSAPVLTPSPRRSDSAPSAGGGTSPSREAPPFYAQFTQQGTLDVHATLLTIARRFEKLERWTVGHVRALEERMGDVEKWLVDKEKEKDQQSTPRNNDGVKQELSDLREEFGEVAGRIGLLGQEMAKMRSTQQQHQHRIQQTQQQQQQRQQPLLQPVYHPQPAPMPSSVPLMQSSLRAHSPLEELDRTVRASVSPVSLALRESAFKEPISAPPAPNTPPPVLSRTNSVISVTSARTRLPYPSGDYTSPDAISPDAADASQPPASPTEPDHLPPPRASRTSGRDSVSPTPRKRYTVALGGPIRPPPSPELPAESYRISPPPRPSPSPISGSPSGGRKARPQSTYILPSASMLTTPASATDSISSTSSIAPLKPRARTRSTGQYGLGISGAGTGGGFVDPVLARKQEALEKAKPKVLPAGRGKAFGDLVAFFDSSK